MTEEMDWVKEVTAVLAASNLSDMKFERQTIPPETEEIGGGPGVTFIINHPDGRQAGAITRFAASPEFTVFTTVEGVPQTLAADLKEAAEHIATATGTTLSEQGPRVLH